MDPVLGLDKIHKVLIVGDSSVSNYRHFCEIVGDMYRHHYPNKILLMSGGTGNMCEWSRDFAEENCLLHKNYSPKHNDILIDNRVVNECIAFWNDTNKTTYDLINRCRQKYIPTRIVAVESYDSSI